MDGETQTARTRDNAATSWVESVRSEQSTLGDALTGALRVPRGCVRAGAVCLRLETDDIQSPGPLSRRLAALLSRRIPVTLDLSHTLAGQIVSRNAIDVPAGLAPFAELLGLRGIELRDCSFSLRCDHADIESFADDRGWLADSTRIIRVCDEFMYAMLCGLDVTLTGGIDRPIIARPARDLWARWTELQGRSRTLALYFGDPHPHVADRSHGSHGGVAAPLIVSTPYAGAQPIFELDLSRFDRSVLLRPDTLCGLLVRVLDRLIDAIAWPDPDIGSDAATRRLVLLQINGARAAARKLGTKPSLSCDRLRGVLNGLRRGLILAGRRRYLQKHSAERHPEWVADVRCPVTRGDIRRRLRLDQLWPNIALAVSPWELAPNPGQCELLPLVSEVDCLIWRPPAPDVLGPEALERLQRAAWAARGKSR